MAAITAAQQKTRPEVFAHHDYREFLQAWIEYNKNLDGSKTLRALSRNADLSPGYLPLVLSGQRSLSEKALKKLMPHLGLKPQEQSYLKILVALGEARSQEERSHALKQIQRFEAYKDKNTSELEVHKYLSRWYLVTIRELVATEGFKWNAKFIQGRLKRHVPVSEIEKAMGFLTKHGFVAVDKNGLASLPNKSLKCEGGVYQIALGDYHREMLNLAVESIDQTEKDARYLSGYTFAVAKENIDAAKEILDEAKKKIVELEQKQKSADSVYHVELSFFPLSEDK